MSNAAIDAYLTASRPPGWSSTSYPTEALFRLFEAAKGRLADVDPAAALMHLRVIDSPYAVVESLQAGGQHHVVFDAGLSRLMRRLELVYDDPNRGTSLTTLADVEEAINALYASRYLWAGHVNRAAVHAAACAAGPGERQFAEPSDQAAFESFAQVQDWFLCAHEIAHAEVGTGRALAFQFESEFRDVVLPLTRNVEEQVPNPPTEEWYLEHAVAYFHEEGLPAPPTEFLRIRYAELWRHATQHAEVRLQDRVLALLDARSPVVEELLCDYLAVRIVMQSLPDLSEVGIDDALLACFAALQCVALIRHTELEVGAIGLEEQSPIVMLRQLDETRLRTLLVQLLARALVIEDSKHWLEQQVCGVAFDIQLADRLQQFDNIYGEYRQAARRMLDALPVNVGATAAAVRRWAEESTEEMTWKEVVQKSRLQADANLDPEV